ncbi:hypothetical protein, partial [Bacillus cereus]|uniref:hypothetical protein n=1 Tax=Bacillus cereus TaxID=1396 RepID=UPI0019D515A5
KKKINLLVDFSLRVCRVFKNSNEMKQKRLPHKILFCRGNLFCSLSKELYKLTEKICIFKSVLLGGYTMKIYVKER